MKREVKALLNSSIDSLLLSIEQFNRPYSRGRIVSVFMLLNHSFEMLLKATIVHKGGKIRERKAKETIGFDHCVRKCLSNAQVQCLNEQQALVIRMINNLRDAATHYLLDITEEQFYLHVQSGVTVFGDILNKVFEKDLSDYLPPRVLPISTKIPKDLFFLINEQVEEIKKLLNFQRRKLSLARDKLRPIAIMENSVKGDSTQPSERDLNKILQSLDEKDEWQSIFPGIASLNINTEGDGLNITLRITKKEGIPIKLLKEDKEGIFPIAVKRVNELDYYSLGAKDLSEKLGLGLNKTLALIHHFKLQESEEHFKIIKIGSSKFKRYSSKALNLLKKELPKVDIDKVWKDYKSKIYKKPQR